MSDLSGQRGSLVRIEPEDFPGSLEEEAQGHIRVDGGFNGLHTEQDFEARREVALHVEQGRMCQDSSFGLFSSAL
jgi:hypothetical protein